MEITSNELKTASQVPPTFIDSLTPNKIDSKSIKDQLKLMIALKDINLIKVFELSELKTPSNTNNGITNLINLLRLIRDHLININKEDNIKNLTIRKSFDNIISSVEILVINKIDLPSDVVNTIILGFLSKINF